MVCHTQAERCHFVFFMEMRVLPPDETRKRLDRVLTALERQKDK
jgi:hypothetical protein